MIKACYEYYISRALGSACNIKSSFSCMDDDVKIKNSGGYELKKCVTNK